MQMAPQIKNQPRLPAMINANRGDSFEEREILYKLLFDMKNDLNDLKSVVHGLIRENDLEISKDMRLTPLSSTSSLRDQPKRSENQQDDYDYDQPTIIERDEAKQDYDDAEVVDDNLSLEAMERQFIKKALIKHAGRRRDAAKDLGISERTLYRKIKEYEINS